MSRMEQPLNTVIIADRDLHMALACKAATFIKIASFCKHPTNSVERLDISFGYRHTFDETVQMFQNGAIQVSQLAIRIAVIFDVLIDGQV